jgi:SAM-dependent methyltransferase
MTGSDRMTLRQTFDSAAARYHQARPDYPEELFDTLAGLAGLRPGDHLLEVGGGTGKATIPLARRGFAVTVLELGAELASRARANLAAFPAVTVVNADFESWAGPGEAPFRMVFAATSWHWISPAVGYRRAHELLGPGGHLAFWSASHIEPERDADPFFREIQPVYDEIGEGLPSDGVFHTPRTLPDSRAGIEATGLFTDVQVRRFDWEISYTAEEYISLLETFSGHIAMEQWQRDRLYGEIRRRLATRRGSRVRRHWGAVLHVARRRE